jgi:hypothetical protein
MGVERQGEQQGKCLENLHFKDRQISELEGFFNRKLSTPVTVT